MPPVINANSEPSDHKKKRIRTWVYTVFGLVLILVSLLGFLLNYSGFNNWENIDANLSMFVAVNVNVVLLTGIFYLVLRNLFQLVFDRNRPLAGVRLKTKLILVLVALSLPSAGFHLVSSGYMAYLLQRWSQGEEKTLLESADIVMDALSKRDDELLRLSADVIMTYLPQRKPEIDKGIWLAGFRPHHRGGVVVFDKNNNRIRHWASGPEEMAEWNMPPEEYFGRKGGVFWKEIHQTKILRRFLIDMPESPDGLKVEVFESVPPKLALAERTLAQKRITNSFVEGDLFYLVLTILIIITLLIILAATWVSVYLARGFVTPIEKLVDGTRLVSEGKLGFQVDRKTLGPLQDDFQELVLSFNRMSRQLKQQRRQLVETTENLQNKHQELDERNQLVELLLENMDAGILSLDPAGTITAMNRAAIKFLQVRGEGGEGRNYRAILSKEFVSLIEGLLERMRQGSLRQLSVSHQPEKGRKSNVLDIGVLSLDGGDQPEGVVFILKDATSEQRKQRALAWREVARRVAHEIKNPLTPIQLSAQRIHRKYIDHEETDTTVLRDCTDIILREVSSLKKMVNEFSRFAKLPDSDPTPQNLNDVIQEVAQTYLAGLPEHIELDLDLDQGLSQMPLDREQMKRVFINLIDNAMAAIPKKDKGTITIRSHFDGERRNLLVEVSDTGYGVPEPIQDRLFEPYTSTKEGGTGLGLTIVNQIVSDHHGFIRYTENKPQGSIFSIEFPLPMAARSA